MPPRIHRMIQRVRQYLKKPGLGPTLVKASLGSAGLRIGGMFFGFLVGVQLARGLGVEGYGVYGLAMSIVALMSVVTEFGLPQLLTREVAGAQVRNDWGRVRGLLSWSSRFVLLISLLVLAAVFVWFGVSSHGLTSPLAQTLFAGVLLVPLVAEGRIRGAALRGMQFIVRSQLPDTLVRPVVFSLLLFVVAWFAPLTPHAAMLLSVAAAAVAFACSWGMLRKALPMEAITATPEIAAREWRSSAYPMALTEGMRVLQGHLSVLLLGWMTTVATVGLFRVASSVAVLMAFPLTLFALVGSPIIARLHAQKDYARLQRLLSWLSLGMTGSTVMMALPFVIGGDKLLGWIFGNEFAASNPILLILCLSTALTAFFGVNAVLLNMTGHQKRVTRASWISLTVMGILGPLMINAFGALGAAVASTISMLVWNTQMWRDGIRLLSLDASFLPLLKRGAWRN
jgi:O-antigen/teichoic acid export membrane protein